MRTIDYRTWLNRKHKRRKAPKVTRTEKRPGDLEIVHVGGGEYRLHRYEGECAA